MRLENSTIYRDVLMIAGKSGRTTYRLKLELFTEDETLYTVAAQNLSEYVDFENNFAEETNIQIVMQPGVYNTKVIPNSEVLFLNIYKTKYSPYQEPEVTKRTYRCFPKTTADDSVSQNSSAHLNQEAINESNLATYEFQIFDEAVEKLRTLQTGGIYPMANTGSVIRVLLGGMSEQLEMPLEKKPLGIEMYPPDTDVYKNALMIRQGVRLVDVAKYLQEHYGVYNTGIGCYYHAQYWHVWPLYNTKRFELARQTLTIVNVPRDRFPGIERTYELSGSSLSIVSTGETVMFDNNNMVKYNQGDGTRAIRASAMSGSEGMTVDKGQVVLHRGKTNTEILTSERVTDTNLAPSEPEVTDNTCRILSRTAVGQGSHMQLGWENSNPDLLVPGMPLKLLYLKGDVVVQRYGTLLRWENLYSLAGPGLTDTAMFCNSALTIFVEPEESDSNSSL